MKIIIASITVCLYFAFTCGVMINLHYCMDRYNSFQLYKPADDKCDICGMKTGSRGCCHDEVKLIKLVDDQKISEAGIHIQQHENVTDFPSAFISCSFYNFFDSKHFYNHSPPLLSGQDIHLQNCVFRI